MTPVSEQDNGVTVSWPSWLTTTIRGGSIGLVAFYLLYLFGQDMKAQGQAIIGELRAHAAETGVAIQRQDTFQTLTSGKLDVLIALQRQTCVNVAKGASQIDDCLKVK